MLVGQQPKEFLLAVEALTVSFDGFKAVNDLSLYVEENEIRVIIGPNGAGKTTTLRMLATLLRASSGSITVDGIDAADHPVEVRRRIGYLSDSFGLYEDLKVWEYLDYYCGAYNVASSFDKLDSVLDLVQLTHKRDAMVGALSRGMRQRLALERALVHRPRLLLLDEPFTGLDQASAAALVARLRGLQAHGALAIVATHDLDVAEGLLTRAIYLRNGRIVREDHGAGQLRERYQAAMSAP